MDTYSLEHWIPGITDVVYSGEGQSIGYAHFSGAQTFIHLSGYVPTELDWHKFRCEAPYPLPDYLADDPMSYGVIHSLPIQRMGIDTFVPAYVLFIVTYFSMQPKVLHSRCELKYEFEGPVSRPYAFKKDWELLPWVEKCKLWWLDLNSDDLLLRCEPEWQFPYGKIEGGGRILCLNMENFET